MKAQPVRSLPRRGLPAILALSAAVLAAAAAPSSHAADVPGGLAGSGVALVPADAAFFFATLRAREQYDRFVKSNAYAALRGIPAVKRALDSLEEQRTMPGNPLSLADTFLQLPENAQAVELLADMIATDTFVYGEPSCAAFVRLVRKLAILAQAAGGLGDDGADVIIEEGEEIWQIGPDGADDAAAAPRATRGMRCQIQFEEVEDFSPSATRKRMVVQTLIDNLDLLVVPDVVWGFRTTKPDVAKAQLARLEVLARMAAEQFPDMARAIARTQVAGGEFLVVTVRGESLPWGELEPALREDAGDIDGFDDLLTRLRRLDACVALGVVGDRVILSFGDSADHLAKLGREKAGLLQRPAFAPLLAHHDKPLTGISYLGAEMAKALAPSPDDMDQRLETLERGLGVAGIPAEAVAGFRALFERFAAATTKRMPEPGPWTAFSWLTDSGYEGRAWNWSRNQPLDGSRRLDLLEHVGGAPLAVVVGRQKSDPQALDDVADFVGGLWSLFQEQILPTLDGENQERVKAFAERFELLGGRLSELVRGKLLPALADGQVGFVLDDKSRTRKPQADLPASAEPLPLPELAIVLPLKDAKLFREGLSDLFAVGDDAVAALREIAPDAVPPDYRVPDPEKTKVGAGTVWSFPLPKSGLDEQFRPSIGVGEQAAVFSLAPRQAGRLLAAARLETGSQLSTFEEPRAVASAADVAGIVDAVKPWIVYLTRYGCVREREGAVEADSELRAADETEQARDVLEAVEVVLEVAKCLRVAVAETAVRDGAVVTEWRNTIRDLPKRR